MYGPAYMHPEEVAEEMCRGEDNPARRLYTSSGFIYHETSVPSRIQSVKLMWNEKVIDHSFSLQRKLVPFLCSVLCHMIKPSADERSPALDLADMNFYASASQEPQNQNQFDQQDFSLPIYANPATDVVGVVEPPPRVDARQYMNLEYPTASSINAGNTVPIRQHPKRIGTMPPKRNAADDANGSTKQIKTERPEEFSNAVKKKLQSSSRTGQACDRCKVRDSRKHGLLRQ
jgi:hypothetical protein